MGIENKSAHSAEEIKTMQEKGEDMMTELQKTLSSEREKSSKILELKGVRGYLEHIAGSNPQEVFGKINGHKIHIIATPEDSSVWISEVDDFKLDASETDRLLLKYEDAIITHSTDDLARAQNLTEENVTKESVLKDIGLLD